MCPLQNFLRKKGNQKGKSFYALKVQFSSVPLTEEKRKGTFSRMKLPKILRLSLFIFTFFEVHISYTWPRLYLIEMNVSNTL